MEWYEVISSIYNQVQKAKCYPLCKSNRGYEKIYKCPLICANKTQDGARTDKIGFKQGVSGKEIERREEWELSSGD